MKKGLLKYSNIAHLTLFDALEKIQKVEGIKYGDIKLSDLLISGSLNDLKLSDFSLSSNYGSGIYIFFEKECPVYVGKAKSFFHRLLSHRNLDVRKHWGWNALIQKICSEKYKISEHTRNDFEKALIDIEEFTVVRILMDTDEDKLSKLERIIMKGFSRNFNTLLNGKIGKVNRDFMHSKVNSLMSKG